MKRGELLDEAKRIVSTDRPTTYGEPEDSFARIAALWAGYLGIPVHSLDVARMMVLLKIARSEVGRSIDSWVDMAGYAACGGEIASGEIKEKPCNP